MSAPKVDETPAAKAKTHRVSFLAGEELVDKIRRAQGFAGTDELAAVIGKALDSYLAKADPRQRAARRQARMAKREAATVAAPRQTTAVARRERKDDATATRYVPAELRDEVLIAAAERCAFVGPDGVRCSARQRLEIDHVRPWSMGGSSTDAENLRVLCKAHNLLLARRVFGERVPQTERAEAGFGQTSTG